MSASNDPESGMTLIEVVLYASLTAMILMALSGLLYTGVRSQQVAISHDSATGAAEVVSASLQTNVRKSSSVTVNGNILRARVAVGATSWRCVSWALTDSHTLVFTTSSGPITNTDFSSWTTLASSISGPDSGPAFSTDSAGNLTYDLVSGSGASATPVRGVLTPTSWGSGDPATC